MFIKLRKFLMTDDWLLMTDYWWLIIHTLYIFSGVHQAKASVWWLIIRKLIKLRKFLIIDCLHTENAEDTDSASGGGRERESSEFKRNLNGGPQADGFVGKQQLSSIGQQLKEKYFF